MRRLTEAIGLDGVTEMAWLKREMMNDVVSGLFCLGGYFIIVFL